MTGWEEEERASLSELIGAAQAHQMTLSGFMLQGLSDPERHLVEMKKRWAVMIESMEEGCSGNLRSSGGMVAGDGRRYLDYLASSKGLLDGLTGRVMGYALAVSECNATMGRICAAPTAGSCGIIPAVFRGLFESYDLEERAIHHALITAGVIGSIIAERATLAGAEGGCQAECGAASAMAAAGAVELMGGSPPAAGHAAALSLKSFLGLVCDPVAGLVEVPCIKRNGIAALHALGAADLALAGVESVIPVDEVIDAMAAVGAALPRTLRETGEGGVAASPTGRRIAERLADVTKAEGED